MVGILLQPLVWVEPFFWAAPWLGASVRINCVSNNASKATVYLNSCTCHGLCQMQLDIMVHSHASSYTSSNAHVFNQGAVTAFSRCFSSRPSLDVSKAQQEEQRDSDCACTAFSGSSASGSDSTLDVSKACKRDYKKYTETSIVPPRDWGGGYSLFFIC